MEERLRYEPVHPGMKDLDRLQELYDTAFPAAEKIYSADEALRVISENDSVEAAAVYDGETMIGFYALTVNPAYQYLQFIATDPMIRGKGYGGQILRKLLEENQDGVLFASIEKPVPGEADYDIRLRRRYFYERNGMITVDRPRLVNGVKFIIVTNRIGEEFERCYENEMKEEAKQFAAADLKTEAL